MANKVSVQISRVSKFVSEWGRMPKTGDQIYGLHYGDEERQAELLASDISAVLGHNQRLNAALGSIMEILSQSSGLAGYHLNGDIAYWDEFDDCLEEARSVLSVGRSDDD